MSSITSAVARNIYNYNKVRKRATRAPYYSTHHYHHTPTSVPDDVEIFSVPEHLREENQKYSPPPTVIGSSCSSQYDCGSARGAVCAADTGCKVKIKLKKLDYYKIYKFLEKYWLPLHLSMSPSLLQEDQSLQTFLFQSSETRKVEKIFTVL